MNNYKFVGNEVVCTDCGASDEFGLISDVRHKIGCEVKRQADLQRKQQVAYAQLNERCVNLLMEARGRLREHSNENFRHKGNWALVGDLNRVEEMLTELNEFLASSQ